MARIEKNAIITDELGSPIAQFTNGILQVRGMQTLSAAGVYGGTSKNASTADQTSFTSEAYLLDSDLLIPSFGLQAKASWMWRISASKTAASTATPVYTIRCGSAKTTSDTSVLALTGPAQTAVADIGTLVVMCTVRTAGSSAIVQGTAWWEHTGTAANTTTSGTGFANNSTGHVEGTSSAVDLSAVGGQYLGLGLTGGASAAWTVTQCVGRADW